MTRRITITLSEAGAVADELALPGTPYIGRGPNALTALGQWVWFHRKSLGLEIELETPHGSAVR